MVALSIVTLVYQRVTKKIRKWFTNGSGRPTGFGCSPRWQPMSANGFNEIAGSNGRPSLLVPRSVFFFSRNNGGKKDNKLDPWININHELYNSFGAMPQISFPMEYYIQIINKDMLPIKAVFYVSCLIKKKMVLGRPSQEMWSKTHFSWAVIWFSWL